MVRFLHPGKALLVVCLTGPLTCHPDGEGKGNGPDQQVPPRLVAPDNGGGGGGSGGPGSGPDQWRPPILLIDRDERGESGLQRRPVSDVPSFLKESAPKADMQTGPAGSKR